MTLTEAVLTPTTRSPRAHRLARRGLVPVAVATVIFGATTVPVGASTNPVVTSVRVPGLGNILESGQRPLYVWVNDPKGQSTCTGGCATIWPPLLVSSKAAHHLGRFSGLGTIHRSKGVLQVTIHHHALYFNAGDHSKSHASGQGFIGEWFTVHANGTLDRSASAGPMSTVPTTSRPAPSPSSSTTTRPTSAPNGPAPTSPPPTSPATTTPTTAPPPPPTTTTYVPPTTTTTTAPSGGGVGF